MEDFEKVRKKYPSAIAVRCEVNGYTWYNIMAGDIGLASASTEEMAWYKASRSC